MNETASRLQAKQLLSMALLVLALGLCMSAAAGAARLEASEGSTMTLFSSKEARAAGVVTYAVTRQGAQAQVELRDRIGVPVGTVSQLCGCAAAGPAATVVAQPDGRRLEVRVSTARVDWWLDGRRVASADRRGRDPLGLQAVRRAEPGQPLDLILALQGEPFADLLGAKPAQNGLLLACPVCPAARAADPPPTRVSNTCGKKGRWVCTRSWGAGTTFRSMSGTKIECGGSFLGIPGYCGDMSHTQPETWIDIVGGVSQSCEDHSTSFYGPLSGEWNGCTSAYQQSTGYQPIQGINQQVSFWPFVGGVQDVWYEGECLDPRTGPPAPPYVWFNGPATFTVSGAFVSVYDLDYCLFKQLMGTVYWPPFTVSSQVVQDQDDYKLVYVTGSVGTACSIPGGSCENDSLCADLVAQSVQECIWSWDDPRTRCDLDCPYGM